MVGQFSVLPICLLFLLNAIPPSFSKTVEFKFDVRYTTASPDGVEKPHRVLTVNGLYPGPAIIADQGDTIVVTVINNIQDGQNTSIHWHGVHQKGTPFEDGTNMIAQCPLKAGGNHQVYTFQVPIPGTYWWHAHMKSQYTEGLWGALIVRRTPKEAYEYDSEILITITDWYHRPAEDLEEWHLSPQSKGAPPFPDSALMNGHGRTNCTLARGYFNCSTTHQKRPIFRVLSGKTYRIRVINTSGYAGFRFSIDGHKLHAIEVDSVDVERTPGLDVVVIASAQRYSFLVTMNATDDRYLIRADLMTEVLFVEKDDSNINRHTSQIMPNATGVLIYERGPWTRRQVDDVQLESFDFNQPLPQSGFSQMSNPRYMDDSLLHAKDGTEAPGDVDREVVLNVTFVEENRVRRGSINGVSFKLPTDKSLLLKMIDNETFSAHNNPVELSYMDVVQVVINNPFDGRHPFHFHGHSFWVMGAGQQGDGVYDKCRHSLVSNGVRRDTVVVHQESWAVIRFIADNPGLWAIHCHIDWHNLSGMAAVFVEAPEMAHTLPIPDEAMRVCAMHNITSTRYEAQKRAAGGGGGGGPPVTVGPLRVGTTGGGRRN